MEIRCRRFVLAVLFLACTTGPWGAVARADTKRVLVLNSYHEGYHWTDRIMAGIHSVFDAQADVELYIN